MNRAFLNRAFLCTVCAATLLTACSSSTEPEKADPPMTAAFTGYWDVTVAMTSDGEQVEFTETTAIVARSQEFFLQGVKLAPQYSDNGVYLVGEEQEGVRSELHLTMEPGNRAFNGYILNIRQQPVPDTTRGTISARRL